MMRKDTRNALVPAAVIGVVLFGATRVQASLETQRYIREAYDVTMRDDAYWRAAEEQYVAARAAIDTQEQERLASLANIAQAESEEKARQIAAERARLQALAAQAAQATTQTQTKTVVQKVTQPKTRKTRAS